jgi:SAM-dependent methyltransferase
MEAEHRARYWWAASAVAGKEVLDAGCGNGYGLRMLAAAGPARLVGVDLSAEAVTRAQQEAAGAAEVVEGDVHDLPFGDESFDVAVCFEVIEHVERQDEVLRELRRVLRPHGTLLISSPNRDVYTPGNPHHVHEFLPEELEAALEASFRDVRLYQQHPWLATAITPPGTPGADELAAVQGGRLGAPLAPGRETYTLAIAGEGRLPELAPLVLLGDDFEVRWWEEQLATLRGECDRLAKTEQRAARSAAGAREELALLSRRILELEQEVARVVQLEHQLELTEAAAREGEAAARADAILLGQVVEDMKASISWKLTAPLRALKRKAKGSLR